MWEYEFEEIHCDDGGGGYSLFGGIGWETLAHQEVILCRAAEGLSLIHISEPTRRS